MKFIVGIGNPGAPYKNTRHNAGFLAVDTLGKSKLDPKKILLVKPETFVNRTGDAVRRLKDRPRFKNQDLLVICDDVNLPFGKLRLRARGRSGGHHGLESVIEAIGPDFTRLRIGVGHEPLPEDLAGFVLEPFSREEGQALKTILANVVSVCNAWAENGLESALDTLGRLQTKNKFSKFGLHGFKK